jgi:hypothetical protein
MGSPVAAMVVVVHAAVIIINARIKYFFISPPPLNLIIYAKVSPMKISRTRYISTSSVKFGLIGALI